LRARDLDLYLDANRVPSVVAGPRNQLYLLSQFSRIGRSPGATLVCPQVLRAAGLRDQLSLQNEPIGTRWRGFRMGYSQNAGQVAMHVDGKLSVLWRKNSR
jgi:hypothetical protein